MVDSYYYVCSTCEVTALGAIPSTAWAARRPRTCRGSALTWPWSRSQCSLAMFGCSQGQTHLLSFNFQLLAFNFHSPLIIFFSVMCYVYLWNLLFLFSLSIFSSVSPHHRFLYPHLETLPLLLLLFFLSPFLFYL